MPEQLPHPHSKPGFFGLCLRGVSRVCRRYNTDQSGVTAIEFGIVGIPFLLLVLGTMEMGLAFFVNRIVDNAVLESARMIRTGQAEKGNFSPAAFKADICSNLPDVLCDLDKFAVDVRSYSSFAGLDDLKNHSMLDEDGNLNISFEYNDGDASSIVVVRVIYRWPMFSALMQFDAGDTGSAERLLSSTAVFRNEPFPY